jgi:ATP-binding cassette, subfamily B, bacterial
VLVLALFLLTAIGLRILNPQIIRRFLDAATAGEPLTNLSLAALTFLGLALIVQLLSVAATYVGENVGWTATNNLRADLALFCLRLDMSFHNGRTPGEMIERIDGDVVDLAIFFAQFIIKILGNLLLLGGILLALYFEDWRIGLALTVYALLSLYALNRLRDIAVPHWKAAREADADLFGFIEEQLSGTEDIRASGAVAYTLRNLFKFDRERLLKQRKAGTMNTLVIQMWIGLYEVGRILAFIGGFYLFTRNLITIGTAYLIVNYTDAIFRPLREITNEIQNLQKAGGSIERIEELYRIPNKIQEGGRKTLPPGPLSVEFDNITFQYNDQGRILQNLSFRLEPAQVLGLLGRTGSGKTTVTRLLFRLYDVTEGEICLQGIDLRDIALEGLQKHIGLVTQDVQLFRASVRNNLTFFDSTIPDAHILEVLEDLELMDWYARLPEGLDTELESGGKGLSAGEAQLLAFTRVFLKDPGLVILDEASSRLDPATEQRIERAVDKLLENRTGIIVAHRLATVQRADQIMILDAGRIGEYGSYAELAGNPQSRFATLLRTGLEEVLA